MPTAHSVGEAGSGWARRQGARACWVARKAATPESESRGMSVK